MRQVLLVPLLAVSLAAARGRGTLAPVTSRYTVDISSSAYHPADLEVETGDTITWINRDIIPHTATSDASPRAIDTGTIAVGDSATYVATSAGVYRYTCSFHPTMQGRLVVRAAAPGAQKQS
jgi:plastocyanin